MARVPGDARIGTCGAGYKSYTPGYALGYGWAWAVPPDSCGLDPAARMRASSAADGLRQS